MNFEKLSDQTKMHSNSEPIDFSKWKSEVDTVLKRVYSINIEQAGIDDDFLSVHFEMKQFPVEFVKWFAEKYDLTE
jgi:hypothetical protein